MKASFPYILLTLLGFLAVAPASASLHLSNSSPQVGDHVQITTDVPADTLIVSYRPSSAVVKTDIFVNDSASTQFEWIPTKPGVVALSYVNATSGETGSTNVSVRFDGLSIPGIVVMLMAALILFGGAAIAFRTLFQAQDQDGDTDLNPHELPDT